MNPKVPAIVMAISLVVAAVLWLIFRPKDQWFPGHSNKLGVMLILGAVVVGGLIALVMKFVLKR